MFHSILTRLKSYQHKENTVRLRQLIVRTIIPIYGKNAATIQGEPGIFNVFSFFIYYDSRQKLTIIIISKYSSQYRELNTSFVCKEKYSDKLRAKYLSSGSRNEKNSSPTAQKFSSLGECLPPVETARAQ